MLNTDLSKYIKDKEYNCIISLLYENNISCVGINSEYKNKYPELKKVKNNKNYLLIKEEWFAYVFLMIFISFNMQFRNQPINNNTRVGFKIACLRKNKKILFYMRKK